LGFSEFLSFFIIFWDSGIFLGSWYFLFELLRFSFLVRGEGETSYHNTRYFWIAE
jgi:hypothetical protein